MNKKILVIDVGGSNVKMMISRAQRRKFKSGPEMTPRDLVTQLKSLVGDWAFDAISIGFPAPVRYGCIMRAAFLPYVSSLNLQPLFCATTGAT